MSQQNSFVAPAIVGTQNPTGSGDYNMTPTAVLYSAPFNLQGQADFSVTFAWSGSDGNPPNGSGSIEVSNVSGSGGNTLVFGGVAYAQPFMPVDTWTAYQVTGALGNVSAFPINGKNGSQPLEIKNCPWRYARLKYIGTGAGSGSLFTAAWIKGRG